MACPLVGEEGVRGAVVVARRAGSRPFSPADVEMAEQLAPARRASRSSWRTDARDEERLAMLEDRHRIARDLHDHVIQRIFATGLTLEAVTGRAADDGRARGARPSRRGPRRDDPADPGADLRAAGAGVVH